MKKTVWKIIGIIPAIIVLYILYYLDVLWWFSLIILCPYLFLIILKILFDKEDDEVDEKEENYIFYSLFLILVVLIFHCFLDIPYGYQIFLRFVLFSAFLALIYLSYKSDNVKGILFYFFSASIFQPFEGVPTESKSWNLTAITIAVFLLIKVYKKFRNDK